jgi:DnaJ-class molecular chaperone
MAENTNGVKACETCHGRGDNPAWPLSVCPTCQGGGKVPDGVKASDEAQRREELSRTGHGHVVPRVDGAKARCGGVMYCDKCKYEREYIAAARGVKEVGDAHR